MMTCGLFSNMFLCCIFIVQCFPASLRITHIIKEMFVYIYIRPNVHVYYIYMYIIIYTVFPCLQDLARLKIALYILAHIPKSLLDPVLGDKDCTGLISKRKKERKKDNRHVTSIHDVCEPEGFCVFSYTLIGMFQVMLNIVLDTAINNNIDTIVSCRA